MAIVNKSNAVPNVTEAKIDPADMLRQIIVAGKAARTAALELCYSAACFILLVSHFKDAKAKGYMTRSDAVEYLKKEIKAQAGVQGGMLDIYIRNASTLAGALMGSVKMFSPVLQRMGLCEKPADMSAILADWMDKNHADKAARRQIDSLSALSEALGFSTGRKPAGGTGLTADRVGDRIAATVKAVEKIVMEGDKAGKKVSARTITSAIANSIPATQSLSLAREAVKRMTDEDDLKALETAIAEQRQNLKALAAKAKEAVAEAKDMPAKVHGKGAKRGQRAPVEHSQA
jgi:hypothetical protein